MTVYAGVSSLPFPPPSDMIPIFVAWPSHQKVKIALSGQPKGAREENDPTTARETGIRRCLQEKIRRRKIKNHEKWEGNSVERRTVNGDLTEMKGKGRIRKEKILPKDRKKTKKGRKRRKYRKK